MLIAARQLSYSESKINHSRRLSTKLSMDTLLILPSRFVTNEGAVSKLAIFVTTPGQDISAVNFFHSKLGLLL
jgi:hypothetical protein